MEFLLELLFTAVVALLFSFLVAKLVSMAGVNDGGSDQPEKTEIGVGDGSATVEELRFGLKIDAPVVQSERKLRVAVGENVEHVDRFGREADRAVDEVEEDARDVELVVPTVVADESSAAVSPENVMVKEMIVCGEEERRDLAGETSGKLGEELIVSTVEAESSTASISPEIVIAAKIINRGQEEELSSTKGGSSRVENAERREVVVTESEEVRVEESNKVEKKSEDKMELNPEEEKEEQEELTIDDDDDDDWEGIERSELEKAFAAASNLLEESGKGEEIGGEAKLELYGLHKIATEGSCREAQPMAVMLSARAKWNAWQKLGNMSQEEAMEQYLALVSKEIPGFMNTDHHTVEKMPETVTSVVLPPNPGSLEDPTTLDTTGAASSKTGER